MAWCCAQAILDVRYAFPKGLSRDCRDLIRGLFHKDPDQRLSIAEIKKHPWFTANLPEEMSVSTSFLSVWRFPSPEVWSVKGLGCSAGQRRLTANLQDEMSGVQRHPEYESMHRRCITSLLLSKVIAIHSDTAAHTRLMYVTLQLVCRMMSPRGQRPVVHFRGIAVCSERAAILHLIYQGHDSLKLLTLACRTTA